MHVYCRAVNDYIHYTVSSSWSYRSGVESLLLWGAKYFSNCYAQALSFIRLYLAESLHIDVHMSYRIVTSALKHGLWCSQSVQHSKICKSQGGSILGALVSKVGAFVAQLTSAACFRAQSKRWMWKYLRTVEYASPMKRKLRIEFLRNSREVYLYQPQSEHTIFVRGKWINFLSDT